MALKPAASLTHNLNILSKAVMETAPFLLINIREHSSFRTGFKAVINTCVLKSAHKVVHLY